MPDEDKTTLLRDLRSKARRFRKSRTRSLFQILDGIRELEGMSRSQRQAVLVHDCGFTPEEANRLLGVAATEIEQRELLINEGVDLDVIAALHKITPEVREEALDQLEAGKSICRRTLVQLTLKDKEVAAREQVKKQASYLVREVTKRAKDELAAYRTELGEYVEQLIDFHEIDQLDDMLLELKMSELSARAGQLLDRFSELFGSEQVEFEEWFFDSSHSNAVRLAKAKCALERLSNKDFVNPELFDYETERYIEAGLVRKVAWLSGSDIARLRESIEARRSYDPDEDDWVGYKKKRETLTSLEICAGAGGQAIGLHAAGFHPLGVFEMNKAATATLEKNYTFGPLFTRDIKDINFDCYRDHVDLIAGGVPCQPHSKLGKRKGGNDERDLFREAVQMVQAVRPRAFMFENVSGFTDSPNSAYRADLFSEFQSAGYDVQVFPITGSDYGLGQKRPRAVVIGFRDGLMSRFKMPTGLQDGKKTLGEVLLPMMSANGWKGAQAWARRANRPCPTLVGGSSKTGVKGFSSRAQLPEWAMLGIDAESLADEAPGADAPLDHMPKLTLQMGARLQGFPPEWSFCGSIRQQRQQIANAFPPIMARAVGVAIYNVLANADLDIEEELASKLIDYPLGSNRANYGATWRAQELELPAGEVRNHAADAFWAKLRAGRGITEDPKPKRAQRKPKAAVAG